MLVITTRLAAASLKWLSDLELVCQTVSNAVTLFPCHSCTCTQYKPLHATMHSCLRYPNWVCHYIVIVGALHHQSVILSWCEGCHVALLYNWTITQGHHHKPIAGAAVSTSTSQICGTVMWSGQISRHSPSSSPVWKTTQHAGCCSHWCGERLRRRIMKESKRQRVREICQPRVCASCLSHGFLFGLFTTASCTSPIELKAHSVFSSLQSSYLKS